MMYFFDFYIDLSASDDFPCYAAPIFTTKEQPTYGNPRDLLNAFDEPVRLRVCFLSRVMILELVQSSK